MAETFAKYSHETMDEIYNAALVKATKGDKGDAKGVDVPKLVSKSLQFFPNIHLTTEEVAACEPNDELRKLLTVRYYLCLIVYL